MGRIYHGAVVASDVTAIDHDERLGSRRETARRAMSAEFLSSAAEMYEKIAF